jgi:hypothetical protein
VSDAGAWLPRDLALAPVRALSGRKPPRWRRGHPAPVAYPLANQAIANDPVHSGPRGEAVKGGVGREAAGG